MNFQTIRRLQKMNVARRNRGRQRDPLLLKLVSVFAKADAIEDHERWLKGLPPYKADAPSETKRRDGKGNDIQGRLKWHVVK
ncbi:hypothetical protein BKD02_01215 [Brucella sp. 09RB8910]|nr:hypothetical protein BKD02_01215 [Brucella sp. 09RB8910]